MGTRIGEYIFKRKTTLFGMTLIELVVVVITLSILVSIAVPQYIKAVERAKDKEAIINVKLMHSAEKIYDTETGGYYTSSNIDSINANLGLDLNNNIWSYRIDGNANRFTARAIRTQWQARTFWMDESSSEWQCNGAGCP
jgi:Tfp pilus assembly protein PilE